MSLSILKGKVVDVHLWTQLEQVESGALDQLRNIAALPWAFHHVAVMPDVHFGKGATVGSVVAMKNAVAPAAVGVDIGCGMGAVPTTLTASHQGESAARSRMNQARSRVAVTIRRRMLPIRMCCLSKWTTRCSRDWRRCLYSSAGDCTEPLSLRGCN